MMKNEKEQQERMYIELGFLALKLYQEKKKMNCDELQEWINKNYSFSHEYGGVRGVLQASHSRFKEIITALEESFVDKNGKPLSDRF